MNDQNLLRYYLNMREPEAYQWNLSPRSLYMELETRDFFARNFEIIKGMNVVNIGIGVGEWDDFLGYSLNGYGQLTSVDIDRDICEIFRYRQSREGHPNPSNIICDDILSTKLLLTNHYELVTMIGSTLQEIGLYHEVMNKVADLLKPNGYLMYMDIAKYHSKDLLLGLINDVHLEVVHIEEYTRYPGMGFYCMKLRKNVL